MNKTPIQYFNEGRQEALRGLPASACPLRYKAWPYEAWQLGWKLGDMESQVYNGHFDPEFSAEPLPDNDKTPFEQGRVAYLKCLRIDACPYDPGCNDAIEWQAGWISCLPVKPSNKPGELYKALGLALLIAGILWALAYFFILR